jgi:hypothetical protein
VDEYGHRSPIVSKSLQDFVYLNPTISSLGYVCPLIAVGELLHRDLPASRTLRRFGAPLRTSKPIIPFPVSLSSYTKPTNLHGLVNQSQPQASALSDIRDELPGMKCYAKMYSAKHIQKCTFYSLCLVYPVVNALLLGLSARLPGPDHHTRLPC